MAAPAQGGRGRPSRQAYLVQLLQLKQTAERLNEEAAKACGLVSELKSGESKHNDTKDQPDGLIEQLAGLRRCIAAHLEEVTAAYRRCFADKGCTQVIGAKIGLIGLEKAGKSTFLSGWATGGRTHQLLPSTTAACTGTTVQVYSTSGSPELPATFSATVEFFSKQEFAVRLLAHCSVVDKAMVELKLASCGPVVREGIMALRTSREPPAINPSVLVGEVNGYLDSNTLWRNVKALAVQNVGNRERPAHYNHVLMLSKLLEGFQAHGYMLGSSRDVPPTANAAELGDVLWPFISMVNEKDPQAPRFTDNLLPTVVKVVSIMGPLPGLPAEIEINDLPGLDSEYQELNARTSEAYKEMDILVFVKNCAAHAQLWPSEADMLSQVRAHVDPSLSRVLGLMNCLNWDLLQPGGQAVNSLVAALDLESRFLRDKSRVLFGFANRGEPSSFDPARVTNVLKLIQDSGFRVDAGELNGYTRFTQQLQGMVEAMPARDISQAQRLQTSYQRVQQEIARVADVAAANSAGSASPEQQAYLNHLYNNVLLPAIQRNITGLRLNCMTNFTYDLIPHNGTLFYFQSQLFDGNKRQLHQLAAAARAIRPAAVKRRSTLNRSLSDETVFSTYEACFQPSATFNPATASQDQVCAPLREAITVDADVQAPGATGTTQLAEDKKYLDNIAKRLSTDLAQSSGGSGEGTLRDEVRLRFRDWLAAMAEREPITFTMMEGQYRRLVREEFDRIIQWIADVDRANIISTLDHLIDVVLLTQIREENGCLLNVYARPASGGSAKMTAMQRKQLTGFFADLKVRVFKAASFRLQEVATETLKLLLGVQRERLVDDAGVQVPLVIKEDRVALQHHMNEVQRLSYKKLILAPCGYTAHAEHDVCQHAGWAPFDWSSYTTMLSKDRQDLLTCRRERAVLLPSKILQLRGDIDKVEQALAGQAHSIFQSAGATAQSELVVTGYKRDYQPANTSSLDVAAVDPMTLPTIASLTDEALRAELQAHKDNRKALASKWDEARRLWQSSSVRLEQVVAFLTLRIEAAIVSRRFMAERVALQEMKQVIEQGNNAVAACDAWMAKLDADDMKQQDKIAAAETQPALIRKQFLESLFCLPLRFTRHDLNTAPDSMKHKMVGKATTKQMAVTELLMAKQDRSFVEKDDFVAYLDDTPNPLQLMENFPPVQGPERELLLEVIHSRTMRALEHINELICHAIQAESSLASSRERACSVFWDLLNQGKHQLYGLVSVNKATIWPGLFANAEQMDNITTCLQNLKDVAAGTAAVM